MFVVVRLNLMTYENTIRNTTIGTYNSMQSKHNANMLRHGIRK